MIKNFPFKAIAALFLISCSDSDKFNVNGEPELKIDIFYEIFEYRNEPYIYAWTNLSLRDDSEYYYWIMDGERFYSQYVKKKVSYGEHLLKFVLIDSFGDTLSKESDVIHINEPLKITLLSPIDGYKAAETDIIEFQYKTSGEKKPQITVYISTDKDVFEKGDTTKNIFWNPPQSEQSYYWGIKAFTEQDTAFSEIRSVWIKK